MPVAQAIIHSFRLCSGATVFVSAIHTAASIGSTRCVACGVLERVLVREHDVQLLCFSLARFILRFARALRKNKEIVGRSAFNPASQEAFLFRFFSSFIGVFVHIQMGSFNY